MNSGVLLNCRTLNFTIADLHLYIGIHLAEDLSVSCEVGIDGSHLQPADKLLSIDDL